ncbi:MAG: signal recognition particle-docking protein FtsY, partial [Deltaproteobacteria bacterium]|nr:signal recognition particle-docking protein FtsY [Deltaproteobacteria bacterium]
MAIFRKKKHPKKPTVKQVETPPSPELADPVENDTPVHGENRNKPENTRDGVFKRLRHGLTKTRSSFTGRIDSLFAGKKEITESLMDELE